jgi:tetratricopeptide (TPR) repeat protein
MMAGEEQEVASAFEPVAALHAAMAPWGKVGLYKLLQERSEKLLPAFSAGARARRSQSAADWTAAVEAFQKLAAVPDLMLNGPAFFPPSQQLLGDVLFAAGRPKDALAAYQRTLAQHPLLARSLLGAARAARAAGDGKTARDRYAALATLWGQPDADAPAVEEVREYEKIFAAEERPADR